MIGYNIVTANKTKKKRWTMLEKQKVWDIF